MKNNNSVVRSFFGLILTLIIAVGMIILSMSVASMVSMTDKKITDSLITDEVCTITADMLNAAYNDYELVTKYKLDSNIYTVDDARVLVYEFIEFSAGNYLSLNISPITQPMKEELNEIITKNLKNYLTAYITKCISDETITDYTTELNISIENTLLQAVGVYLPDNIAPLLQSFEMPIVMEYPENYEEIMLETPMITVDEVVRNIYPTLESSVTASAATALDSTMLIKLQPYFEQSLTIGTIKTEHDFDAINNTSMRVAALFSAGVLIIITILFLIMVAMYPEKRVAARNLGIAAIPAAALCIYASKLFGSVILNLPAGLPESIASNIKGTAVNPAFDAKCWELLNTFAGNAFTLLEKPFYFTGIAFGVIAFLLLVMSIASKISATARYRKRVVYYDNDSDSFTNDSIYNSTFMSGAYDAEENAAAEAAAQNALYEDKVTFSNFNEAAQNNNSYQNTPLYDASQNYNAGNNYNNNQAYNNSPAYAQNNNASYTNNNNSNGYDSTAAYNNNANAYGNTGNAYDNSTVYNNAGNTYDNNAGYNNNANAYDNNAGYNNNANVYGNNQAYNNTPNDYDNTAAYGSNDYSNIAYNNTGNSSDYNQGSYNNSGYNNIGSNYDTNASYDNNANYIQNGYGNGSYDNTTAYNNDTAYNQSGYTGSSYDNSMSNVYNDPSIYGSQPNTYQGNGYSQN